MNLTLWYAWCILSGGIVGWNCPFWAVFAIAGVNFLLGTLLMHLGVL